MTNHNKVILTISMVYIVFMCVVMISHNLWFSPDQFFVFALFAMLIIGRARLFLLDWGPFLLLFLGYEFMRGVVPFISKNVHILPMIRADQFLFGFIPTIKFQELWFTPTNLQWYDYFAVTVYICHFVTPMVMGLYLWLRDRVDFKEYAIGILILSYASFLTYILFPAMPPWMASSQGYLPPVQDVIGTVSSHFLKAPTTLPTIYSVMRPNPVAAMPSLHAAYPTFIFLFLWKKNRKLAMLLIPYVVGVWFAVIYLGEHYFVDILVGIFYAVITFWILEKKDWFAQHDLKKLLTRMV